MDCKREGGEGEGEGRDEGERGGGERGERGEGEREGRGRGEGERGRERGKVVYP